MEHIIKANDTPYSLAKHYVNNGNRWPELCTANPQLPKHADWGCVFTVNKTIKLPDSWVVTVAPSPIPGPVPQPTGPAIPTDPNAALVPVAPTSSPGLFGSIDPKKVMIGGAVVAAGIVAVYAMKRKKTANA